MFGHIKNLILRIQRDASTINQHMIVYFQMKNLIQCFSEILEYLMCNDSYECGQRTCEKIVLKIEKDIETKPDSTKSQNYIVRRYKYCNFCGHA